MAGISFELLAVPVTAAAVLRMKQNKAALVTYKFRNEGGNVMTAKIQESADNSSYSDIASANATINPGGRKDISALSHQPYLQIVCGGNSYAKLDMAFEGMLLEGQLDILLINTTSGGWPVQPS